MDILLAYMILVIQNIHAAAIDLRLENNYQPEYHRANNYNITSVVNQGEAHTDYIALANSFIGRAALSAGIKSNTETVPLSYRISPFDTPVWLKALPTEGILQSTLPTRVRMVFLLPCLIGF